MTKHIILIGFKHSGKSAIGKALAQVLGRQFLDLDELTSKLHYSRTGEKLSVREIVRGRGESYFRQLEIDAFKQALALPEDGVIAAGGGTPMHPQACGLMRPHWVILVKAPKGIIFERIMMRGRPAFFPPDAEPYQAFCRVLAQREPVYDALAGLTVENNASVNQAVDKIITGLAHRALLGGQSPTPKSGFWPISSLFFSGFAHRKSLTARKLLKKCLELGLMRKSCIESLLKRARL